MPRPRHLAKTLTLASFLSLAVLAGLPAAAATYTVTSTSDSGTGTLREAMSLANTNPGLDTIEFDLPGPGPYVIKPLAELPTVTDPAILDATTQPGYAGEPVVVLDGIKLTYNIALLRISAGNTTVRGFTLRSCCGLSNDPPISFGWGIFLTDAGANLIEKNAIFENDEGIRVQASSPGNVIRGNLIGTDPGGTPFLGNSDGIFALSAGNTIGGTGAGDGNVVADNYFGIWISMNGAAGNTIQGNFIGTDPTGTKDNGNGTGIYLTAYLSGGGTILGGAAPGARNLISGNGTGIKVNGSRHVVIQGNYVGTDVSGTAALGNSVGIDVDSQCEDVIIGGNDPGAGNVISASVFEGVLLSTYKPGGSVLVGNLIGTDAAGKKALPNGDGVVVTGQLSQIGPLSGPPNVISGNTRTGVVLWGDQAVVFGNLIGTDITGTAPLGNGTQGVLVQNGSDGNFIGGTFPGPGNVISGNPAGIVFDLTGNRDLGNVVAGNLIGTDVTGTRAVGNSGPGIRITNSSFVRIGGLTAPERNVISGNGTGIDLSDQYARQNTILGNLIGTDAAGAAAIPNGTGIRVKGGDQNRIGGTDPGAGNVISANGQGVRIEGATAQGNRIEGNRIGTDAAGTTALGNGGVGVGITDGSANRVGGSASGARNLISANGVGIRISGALASDNEILGNFIGTDATGSSALGNDTALVVLGPRTVIGSGGPGEGNLVSGNGAGIQIGSDANRILGNLVGTSAAGTEALGNGSGIEFEDSSDNVLGGASPGAGNLVSSNGQYGIVLGGDSSRNVIVGNRIGTDVSGNVTLGNAGDGLRIEGSGSRNRIGGTIAAEGNVIAHNAGAGAALRTGTGNLLRANGIFGNGGLGIDLGPAGVNPDDPGDFDLGVNMQQNAPALSRVSGAGSVVQGTLSSTPFSSFTIDFYGSDACDPSGFGEGAVWLGSVPAVTDKKGIASLYATLAGQAPIGGFVTATATDAMDDTSEFSRCAAVAPPGPADDVEILMGRIADAGTGGSIAPRDGDSLRKALAKAVPALERGQPASACKALRSFIGAVGKLQARGTVPPSLAQSFTDDAAAILATLACPS